MSDRDQVVIDESTEPGPESPALKRVLTIFAHPDDPDFSCGGTMARWAREGHEVTYCLVTSGDKGSDDPEMTGERLVEIREREQRAAAAITGVREVIYLRRPDGMVVHDLELRRDLVRVLRTVRPHVVVCGDPSVRWYGQEYINHPDHRAVAEAALAAVFPASGNRLYLPELLAEGLEPHSVSEVYLSGPAEPDTWIDITETIGTKVDALRAHASQMGDWDPDEPIREWGRRDGEKHTPPVEYAEDFRYFKLGG